MKRRGNNWKNLQNVLPKRKRTIPKDAGSVGRFNSIINLEGLEKSENLNPISSSILLLKFGVSILVTSRDLEDSDSIMEPSAK